MEGAVRVSEFGDKNKESEEKERARCIGSVLGAHNSAAGQRVAGAAEKLLSGDKILDKLIESRKNCTVESTAGYAAELHHKVTFEADAILKGKQDLSVGIGPRGGCGSKGSADLVINKGNKNVGEAGLKYRAKATETAFDQSNPFDRGRQKICPSDQVDRVKQLANERAKTGTLKAPEYSDTAKNATDRLEYDGVESKPLTKSGAEDLVRNGGNYGNDALKLEMRVNTVNAAKAGAALGAAASTASNIINCWNGEKSIADAGKQVIKDTVKSGARSAAVSAMTTGTKHALLKAGAQNLAKGNAPMAIASTIFEAGGDICSDIKKCCNGEVTKTEVAVNAVKHTGKAAAKTGGAMAGAEMGATIGAFGGPIGIAVGGVVGGTVGYIASSTLVSKISDWF